MVTILKQCTEKSMVGISGPVQSNQLLAQIHKSFNKQLKRSKKTGMFVYHIFVGLLLIHAPRILGS